MDVFADRNSEPLFVALMVAAEERVKKYAREVSFSLGDEWPESSTPRYAHFLRSGAVSRVICLRNSQCAGVRLSTRGELLETHSVAGGQPYADWLSVVLPSQAIKVPFDLVQEVFAEDLDLRAELISQISRQSLEVARTSACNIFHCIEARLARYLLKLSDHWAGPLPITQESLAKELSVQRTSITFVAGDLRRRGILKLGRGRIEVIDRIGLSKLVCECHKTDQASSREAEPALASSDGLTPSTYLAFRSTGVRDCKNGTELF